MVGDLLLAYRQVQDYGLLIVFNGLTARFALRTNYYTTYRQQLLPIRTVM